MWAAAEQRAGRTQAVGGKHMVDSRRAYGYICKETGNLPTAAIKSRQQQAAEENSDAAHSWTDNNAAHP